MLPYHIDAVIDRLDNGSPLHYVFFGDGEFQCLLRNWRKTTTCHGEAYDDYRSELLWNVLRRRRVNMYGLWPGASALGLKAWRAQQAGGDHTRCTGDMWIPEMARRTADWLDEYGISDLPYVCAKPIREAMHFARGGGRFVACLRRHHTLLIGPEHLKKLDLLPDMVRAQCPYKDALADIDEIEQQARRAVREHNIEIVCVSMGMTANILIDRLLEYDDMQGVSMLDVGSIWDGYCGVASRGCIKRHDQYAETMRRIREEADNERQ